MTRFVAGFLTGWLLIALTVLSFIDATTNAAVRSAVLAHTDTQSPSIKRTLLAVHREDNNQLLGYLCPGNDDAAEDVWLAAAQCMANQTGATVSVSHDGKNVATLEPIKRDVQEQPEKQGVRPAF